MKPEIHVGHLSADLTRRSVLQLACMAAFAPAVLLACGGDAAVGTDYSGTITQMRSHIRQLLADTGTPAITVALVDDQRLVWSESFGKIDAIGTAPTVQTMFPIASVTKVVATVAAMILVDRGLVELDMPFVRYVSAFSMQSPEYAAITVRMLLSHSSGLPGDDNPNGSTLAPVAGHAQRVLNGLAARRLKHLPGEMAVYCNDGFTLIEILVQAVTGKSFTDFVRDEILLPLDMNKSAFTTTAPFAGTYAPAFHTDGTARPLEWLNVYASGGLYSTPSDMGKLAQMFINGGRIGTRQLLSQAAITEMSKDQILKLQLNPATDNDLHYGLGWDGVRDGALATVGVACWHKNGGSMYQSAELLVLPQAKLGVMVMGSSHGYDPHALAVNIALQALVERGSISGMPTPLASKPLAIRSASSAELTELAGIYAHSSGIYRLGVTQDNRLELSSWASGQWKSSRMLSLREDGKFSFDGTRYPSFRFPIAEGKRYMLTTTSVGAGYHANEYPTAQRTDDSPTGSLLPDWQARIGRRWLAVNFDPAHAPLADGSAPVLTLEAAAGLPSYVMVSIPALEVVNQVVDPRASADRALMCLKIPLDVGRDLADLVVQKVATVSGSEEWLGWSSTQFRPIESVPLLAIGSSVVAIGAQGYAEWRLLPALAARLSITSSSGWKLYRDDGTTFKLLDQSIDGLTRAVDAPVGAYLMVYGTAGVNLVVQVTAA